MPRSAPDPPSDDVPDELEQAGWPEDVDRSPPTPGSSARQLGGGPSWIADTSFARWQANPPRIVNQATPPSPPPDFVRAAVENNAKVVQQVLDDVGGEMLHDPALTGQVEEIKNARKALASTKTLHRTVRSAAAEAVTLIAPPAGTPPADDPRRPAATREIITMGGVEISERQRHPADRIKDKRAAGFIKTEMQVRIGGTTSFAAAYDPEIRTALEQMTAAGLSAADIRQAVFKLLANRPPGPAFADKPAMAQHIAAIARVMFSVEGARNPAALSTSYMAWALADQPGITWHDVVIKLNPMHVKYASKFAERARALLGPDVAYQARKLLNNQSARGHRDVVIRYIRMLIDTGQLAATDAAQVEGFIVNELSAHLRARLRPLLIDDWREDG
jgi:hypothetical protein